MREGKSSSINPILSLLMGVVTFTLVDQIRILPSAEAAVSFGDQNLFGHSIKNGVLPPSSKGEIDVFEHECQNPPCVITQINVPSIYPPHQQGASWNWTNGILRIYQDNDDTPEIALTLLELAGESRFHDLSSSGNLWHDDQAAPWGTELNGRTAKSGGVYSTIRIPFENSIRVTMQAPEYYDGNGVLIQENSVFWISVRGLESFPVIVGDLQLPPKARLRVAKVDPTEIPRLGFISIGESPPNTKGVFLKLQWDGSGPDFSYLEACLRFQEHQEDNVQNPLDSPTLFLSSGMEDFFLSASYFDLGMFRTQNSGLTYFDKNQSMVGAYKSFVRDPVIFHNGFQLTWRNMETTGGCGNDFNCCPNRFCCNEDGYDDGNVSSRVQQKKTDDDSHEGHSRFASCEATMGSDYISKHFRGGDREKEEHVVYSSLLWYYSWRKHEHETVESSKQQRQQ